METRRRGKCTGHGADGLRIAGNVTVTSDGRFAGNESIARDETVTGDDAYARDEGFAGSDTVRT